jgi:PPK2 family polyphosphate:nucleotide phosphotransferase
MSYRKKFKVEPGSKVKLKDIDASYKGDGDKAAAQDQLEKYTQRLAELQYLMYAENKRSLLIVLQAMDAGGKDGVIRHVVNSMNPQGCTVTAFKTPSTEELSHDYLWRIHKVTPSRGHVAIFNRSHYDDVLIVRVHNLVPKNVWLKRYDEINAFEKELVDNGTHILKFYLHIDKDEQLARFKQRLEDSSRQWKISELDYKEREYWDDYQKAYEDAINNCSTDYAPWYTIPANRKWFRNLAISQILTETLESFKMSFPAPTVNIAEIKKKYHAAKEEQKKE